LVYRLAIFDFDGTLADSAGWLLRNVNPVADRYGFERIPHDAVDELRGLDGRALLRRLNIPMWKLPLIARHMHALMSRDADEIVLFDGAAELLGTLRAGGIALAIVSSNSEANVRRVLGPANAALIGHYGCGAGLFGKGARFRQAVRRAGVRPGEAIGIGDELRDIDAAEAEGLASGAVTWGYATPTVLRARRPTFVFDSMAAIAEALVR